MAEWTRITPTTEAMAVPGGMIVRCRRDSDEGGIAAVVFVPGSACQPGGGSSDWELREWIKENKQ